MSAVLALVMHDRGAAPETTWQAVTSARGVAAAQDASLEAVVVGDAGAALAAEAARYGCAATHVVAHELLSDFGPEACGESLAQLVAAVAPAAVIGPGTERGNEVMAHLAARTDLPLVANCAEVAPGEPWRLTRVRWGGSLLEEAELDSPGPALLTIAAHAVAAEPAPEPAAANVVPFTPDLDPALARTRVVGREEAAKGVTLTTAPVVVSGGRGVGSPEGFAVLEELAAMLRGAVGCSRVATNNGWRPHSDQVGQTGTRIAPELYIACGISGAIQHWVGCMASKNILAINTDPEANMVMKADYAVIGDLHEVLNAVVAELRGREG